MQYEYISQNLSINGLARSGDYKLRWMKLILQTETIVDFEQRKYDVKVNAMKDTPLIEHIQKKYLRKKLNIWSMQRNSRFKRQIRLCPLWEKEIYHYAGIAIESLQHIGDGCNQLTQNENKLHPPKKKNPYITLELLRYFSVYSTTKCGKHSLPLVAENEQVKTAWNTTILTVKRLESNRLAYTFEQKNMHKCILVDFAVSLENTIM